MPTAGAAAPLAGTITSCSSNWSCDFVFNTTTGPGWANGTSTGYLNPGTLTLKLPGEANTSTGLTYSTYIQSLTGTYTYWTVGNFIGADVNTGTVVYGTTNSNYTITCHGHSGRGGGCTYTYTTDNGTIVVTRTLAEMTSLTLSCSPTTINSGKTSCTATVLNLWSSSNTPTGKLHISSTMVGKFSNNGTCTLSSAGTCAFTWTPSANGCGSSTLSAAYGGTRYFYKSSDALTIVVNVNC